MITSVIEKNTEKKSNMGLFHILALLCFIIISLVSFYLYNTIRNQIKQSVINRVNTVALALDPEEFTGLSAIREDEQTEAYKKLKKKLIALNAGNSDTRYFYIAVLRDGNIYFLADSEYEDKEYGYPGLLYDEATDVYKKMFSDTPVEYFEISTDKWGSWVSAFSVIPQGDNPIRFVMGIDIPAHEYRWTPIYVAAIPFIVFIGLCVVLVLILRKRKIEIDALYTKNRFLAIASHELRAPLTGIRWSSEILKGSKEIPSVEKKVATDIYNSSIGLIKIVNELLDVFTIESKLVDAKKFTSINMVTAIQEAITQLSTYALERNIFINFNSDESVDSGILMVKAEPARMNTVLTNIITNAIKYSLPNSEVIISIKVHKNMVRIRVKDTGIGIPAESISKVTKGFYRAENAIKATSGGTGLGLYLVHTIVGLHGGKLKIESELHKGTQIIIDLPLSV